MKILERCLPPAYQLILVPKQSEDVEIIVERALVKPIRAVGHFP